MHVGGSVKKVGGGGKDSRSMRYHRSRSALMHMVEKTSGCDMAGRRSQWADVAVGGGMQELSLWVMRWAVVYHISWRAVMHMVPERENTRRHCLVLKISDEFLKYTRSSIFRTSVGRSSPLSAGPLHQ